jgi:hypothetical protein
MSKEKSKSTKKSYSPYRKSDSPRHALREEVKASCAAKDEEGKVAAKSLISLFAAKIPARIPLSCKLQANLTRRDDIDRGPGPVC